MQTTVERTFRQAKQRPESLREVRRAMRRAPRRDTNGSVHAAQHLVEVQGVLEIHPEGYGFLRDFAGDLQSRPGDAFLTSALISRYGLRPGVMIEGAAENRHATEGPRLIRIDSVDGIAADGYAKTRRFDVLTPIIPEQWLRLETTAELATTRVIDLLAPLGKGQRALIIAPPRSGKTVLLHRIGEAITANHPNIKLMALLVDERPEEVTDFRRALASAEIYASSLDRDVANHVRLAQLAIERAKRLAEEGHDVFVIMDSITRMARAFNKAVGGRGRTMSGGLDIRALDIPKRLFASARAFEEGGSLTIVATILVETGSRMDELILQEFKGTGNTEIVLDRRLADRRIWPAIDVSRTGTRREEKLLDAATLEATIVLRRTLSSLNDVEAMEQLTKTLVKFRSNGDVVRYLSGVSTA